MSQQLPDDASERPLDDAPRDEVGGWEDSAAGAAPTGRRRVVVASVGGALLVAAAIYLVGYLQAGDRLPREAKISGVAVGGLAPAAATSKLDTELVPNADRPIRTSVGTRTVQVVPSQAGLSYDIPASVARAGGGRSADPRHIWHVLTGGGPSAAVVAVDSDKLASTVQRLADDQDADPVDAAVVVKGATADVRPAVEGTELTRDAAAASLQRAFAARADSTVLAVQKSMPEITTAEATRVRDEFAAPAVSGPVVLTAGQAGEFTVTAKQIGASLRFAAVDGTLVPSLDAAKLRELADDAFDDVEIDRAKDADVRIVDGKPKVIPAVDGTRLTAEELARAVTSVLTKQGSERSATVQLSGAKAKFSTADAEKLGITEVTGKFTTRFPYAYYRNVNIGRAAELINGTLLMPGETFSLNDTLGERTKANGFTEGNIITGGKFRLELGGGVSQSATTTFNAMFFAGLKDVEHRPHTLYINRYPAGREATVVWPSLDMRFQNDTDHGVLVEAKRVKAKPGKQGSLTVKMWSTKTYDKVTSTKLVRSNFTTGRDVEDSSPKCQPMAPVAGFDVRYSRLFYRDGEVVKREKFSWRYNPTDRVRCS